MHFQRKLVSHFANLTSLPSSINFNLLRCMIHNFELLRCPTKEACLVLGLVISGSVSLCFNSQFIRAKENHNLKSQKRFVSERHNRAHPWQHNGSARPK